MSANDYLMVEVLERAFERKRAHFIADYGLGENPALIWQCMPAEPLVVDVGKESVREALREGASGTSNTAWWYAFKSGRSPALIFEGLASSSVADAIGWATEVHEDGHFLAGVWSFPDVSASIQTTGHAIAEFYVDAFRDVGLLVNKVYKATAYTAAARVTCTMRHSNKLPLVTSHERILAPAVKRSELRWPVLTVEDLEHISTACTAMAAQFMRAYGRSVPNR